MNNQPVEQLGIADLLSNAERLLEDARVLRKNRKYASALGIAVLSIEEAGKLVMRMGGLGPPQSPPIEGRVRSHKLKQKIAASALIASMANADVNSILEAYGVRRIFRPIDPHNTDDEGDEFVKTSDFFSRITAKEYSEKLSGAVGEKHQVRIIIQLCRGEFDQLKQSSFYVDIDDKHSTVPVPSIDRGTADRVLRIASRTITMIKRARGYLAR